MGVWWVIVALFRPSPVSRESGDARMHGKQDAIVNLQSMWPNGKQLSIIVSPCANVCAFLTFFFGGDAFWIGVRVPEQKDDLFTCRLSLCRDLSWILLGPFLLNCRGSGGIAMYTGYIVLRLNVLQPLCAEVEFGKQVWSNSFVFWHVAGHVCPTSSLMECNASFSCVEKKTTAQTNKQNLPPKPAWNSKLTWQNPRSTASFGGIRWAIFSGWTGTKKNQPRSRSRSSSVDYWAELKEVEPGTNWRVHRWGFLKWHQNFEFCNFQVINRIVGWESTFLFGVFGIRFIFEGDIMSVQPLGYAKKNRVFMGVGKIEHMKHWASHATILIFKFDDLMDGAKTKIWPRFPCVVQFKI